VHDPVIVWTKVQARILPIHLLYSILSKTGT
jgi:hypothetical protein